MIERKKNENKRRRRIKKKKKEEEEEEEEGESSAFHVSLPFEPFVAVQTKSCCACYSIFY